MCVAFLQMILAVWCPMCWIVSLALKYEFEGREDVILWIINNQLGRRNLPSYRRVALALKLDTVIAEMTKKRKLATLKQNVQNNDNTVTDIYTERGNDYQTSD